MTTEFSIELAREILQSDEKCPINLADAINWTLPHVDVDNLRVRDYLEDGLKLKEGEHFEYNQQDVVLIHPENDPANYSLSMYGFNVFCFTVAKEKAEAIYQCFEVARNKSAEIVEVKVPRTSEEFLRFLKGEIMFNGNLSIRAVARCCGVSKESIIDGGEFGSVKLGQMLTEQEFKAGELVDNGFPPQAVWIVIEYFAWESKAKAPMAKQLARTLGSVAIINILQNLINPTSTSNSDTLSELTKQNQTFLAGLTNKLLGNEAKVDEAIAEVKAVKEEVKAEISDVKEVVQEQGKKAEKAVKFANAYTCDEGYETIKEHLESLTHVNSYSYKDDKGVYISASKDIGSYMYRNGYKSAERKIKVEGSKYMDCQWRSEDIPVAIYEMALEYKVAAYYNPKKPSDKIQFKRSEDAAVMDCVVKNQRTTLSPDDLFKRFYPSTPLPQISELRLSKLIELSKEKRPQLTKLFIQAVDNLEARKKAQKAERAAAKAAKQAQTATTP